VTFYERINVEQAVRGLDLDDLGSRAGNHSGGYTSPAEAAWELIEETVEPLSWKEADWVDEDATKHRGPDE
jgi:hypothetical protein